MNQCLINATPFQPNCLLLHWQLLSYPIVLIFVSCFTTSVFSCNTLLFKCLIIGVKPGNLIESNQHRWELGLANTHNWYKHICWLLRLSNCNLRSSQEFRLHVWYININMLCNSHAGCDIFPRLRHVSCLVQSQRLLCTHGQGVVLKCAQHFHDTVMTLSKTEPSVPGSQEAMRLMSCDNL